MAETFAQFASPAKRRKMCPEGEIKGAVYCGINDVSAGSRLKHGTGVTPKKVVIPDEPSTPGNKQAGMEDGLLYVSPEQLPANLMLLNQLLGALYVTMPLLRSRGKPTTYQNLRAPVESFSGRDFQIKHLQQIKALCPGALEWEHILTTNATTKRQEQQLLIKLPSDSRKSKQTFDTANMQLTFFRRLQQHAQEYQSTTDDIKVPMAELPPAAGPKARDSTPSRRGTNGQELLPGTPQTAPPPGAVARTNTSAGAQDSLLMSPPPKRATTCFKGPAGALMSPPPARTRSSRSKQATQDEPPSAFTFSPAPRGPPLNISKLFSPAKASDTVTPVKCAEPDSNASARTPALRPNKLFGTPLAAATPQQKSSSRPTDRNATPVDDEGRVQPPIGAVKARRLTFDAAMPSALSGTKKPTGSGITFELGDKAMALLQRVSDVEVQAENTARQQELDRQRALDMLPGTFDVLRGVFGDKGPCVKPKTEVLQLLRQKCTCKSGMSPADASEQLDLVLRFVPEFIRTVNVSGQLLAGMTQSVRINRQVTWPAARHKLLSAAAEARSTGTAAASHAVAADKEREEKELLSCTAEVSAPGAGASQKDSDSEHLTDECNVPVCSSTPAEVSSNWASTGKMTSCHTEADGSSDQDLSDEALLLLSGGLGSSSTTSGGGKSMPASFSACLAFRAPARKLR